MKILEQIPSISKVAGPNVCLEPILEILGHFSTYFSEGIRKKAIWVMEELLSQIDFKAKEDTLAKFIKSLAHSKFYAAKELLASLIPKILLKFSLQSQNDCLRFDFLDIRIYVDLLKDKLPIIRKFAAQYLKVIFS